VNRREDYQLPVQVTAKIQGHPWDLWGMSRLFNGTDSTKTKVTADKPEGMPRADLSSAQAAQRFRLMGYDVFAELTSDELLWDEKRGPVDLRDVRPVAEDVVARINGITILLDPDFVPVKLQMISYETPHGAGASSFGEWRPNKSMTFLGHHPNQILMAEKTMALSKTDPVVHWVLDAIVLPRSWASLYLVYEAIADDVGGVHDLKRMNWVGEDELSDFTNSANNNRKISEGARHAKRPSTARPLIPLVQAVWIINRLVVAWLDWRVFDANK
jgi:hypothetical protein